jgi:branched-subunit amino acid transport protein AzlD
MKKLYKYIYKTSIFIIIASAILLLFGRFLPFEFTNNDLKSKYFWILGFSITVSILLTLARFGYRQEIQKNYLRQSVIAVILSILTLPLLFFLWLGTCLCGYTVDSLLYRHMSDETTIIVSRHYDCGAFDSDMPQSETYKIVPLTNHINYVEKINVDKIDPLEWKKISR